MRRTGGGFSLLPSRHGSTKERGNFFFFCKLSELLHSDHTKHVNIYTHRGELAHATRPVCPLPSSLFSLKCRVFLPFCLQVPRLRLLEGVTFLFFLLLVLQGGNVRVMEPGPL